mgnify:FL=1
MRINDNERYNRRDYGFHYYVDDNWSNKILEMSNDDYMGKLANHWSLIKLQFYDDSVIEMHRQFIRDMHAAYPTQLFSSGLFIFGLSARLNARSNRGSVNNLGGTIKLHIVSNSLIEANVILGDILKRIIDGSENSPSILYFKDRVVITTPRELIDNAIEFVIDLKLYSDRHQILGNECYNNQCMYSNAHEIECTPMGLYCYKNRLEPINHNHYSSFYEGELYFLESRLDNLKFVSFSPLTTEEVLPSDSIKARKYMASNDNTFEGLPNMSAESYCRFFKLTKNYDEDDITYDQLFNIHIVRTTSSINIVRTTSSINTSNFIKDFLKGILTECPVVYNLITGYDLSATKSYYKSNIVLKNASEVDESLYDKLSNLRGPLKMLTQTQCIKLEIIRLNDSKRFWTNIRTRFAKVQLSDDIYISLREVWKHFTNLISSPAPKDVFLLLCREVFIAIAEFQEDKTFTFINF